MTKPSDDDLILHFYGEHGAADDVARALARDPELSCRYDALTRELRALDHLTAREPRPGLEARIWARVEPSVAPPAGRAAPARGWLRWAALGSAIAAVVLAAFLAGRLLRTAPTETEIAHTLKGLPADARERVLEAALADHLEASQRLLLEVANGTASLNGERDRVRSLLNANSLYRRASERARKPRISAVLTELDALLKDFADASDVSEPRIRQARADSHELLFKVRVARNDLKRFS